MPCGTSSPAVGLRDGRSPAAGLAIGCPKVRCGPATALQPRLTSHGLHCILGGRGAGGLLFHKVVGNRVLQLLSSAMSFVGNVSGGGGVLSVSQGESLHCVWVLQ